MAYAALIKSGRLYGTGLREQLPDNKYLIINKFLEEDFDVDIDKIFIKDALIAVIDIHKNLYIKTLSQKYFQFVQPNVLFISGESIDDFAIINDNLDIIANKSGTLGSGFVRVCYSLKNLCAIDRNGNLWGSGELFGGAEILYPINDRIKFVQIYCDDIKFLGLDSEGYIHALGDFTNFGLVESTEILSELTVIRFAEKITEFAVGEIFCFFVTQNNDLYGCGRPEFLGIGYYDYEEDFVLGITHIERVGKVRQVACIEYSTYILTINGELFVCGENTYGQLGVGSLLSHPSQFDGDYPANDGSGYEIGNHAASGSTGICETQEDEIYICAELPYISNLSTDFEVVNIDGIDNLPNREKLPVYFGSTKSARSK